VSLQAQVEELLAPVDRLVATGLVPLLAASAARTPGMGPAAAYLYANPSTRAAAQGVVRSIGEASARARELARAGRPEAVPLAQSTVRQSMAFVTELQRALPQADAVLTRLAGRLAVAPLEGLQAGLGFAAIVAVGVLLLALGRGR
jgi:uncharacterized protein YfaQ (DUF2300 family)